MKKKQLLAVVVVILLTAGIAIARQLLKSEEICTVAVAPQVGVTVLSENPVTVRAGENAAFLVDFDDNYYFGSTSMGVYENGVLTIDNVQHSRTVYVNPIKRCQLTLNTTTNGTARFASGDTAMEGESVSLQLFPDDNYENGTIEINGVTYPAPTGDSFNFVVQDDSVITVNFSGRALDFLTVSGNLGHIKVNNASEVYRYGDVISLACDYNNEHIVFNGWSKGGFLSDNGELLSTDENYEYTLIDSTTLYANFTDRSAYLLSYDANEGAMELDIAEEHALGECFNLALSSDSFTREGYTLIGFSTQPDGEGELLTPGAMFQMPNHDLTLYAQWAENTQLSYLKYSVYGNEVTIDGLSEDAIAEKLTSIVIPSKIEGKPVTAIRAEAFRGNTSLVSVVLPIGLRILGEFSFADCPSLTTVYFPETITSIYHNAFSNSCSFKNMRVIASMERAFDYDYDSGLAIKYMRLKNTEGKRIILVGGSNLAFGINSAMIKEEFPEYSIINMGVSMYYGIIPSFDLLRANVNEGDIVIFCPEYSTEMYAANEIYAITNWQYLESNYDMLKDINLQENMSFLRYFTEYLATKQSYLPGKKINTKPAYARTGFNEYGDMSVSRPAYGSYELVIPPSNIITDDGMCRYNDVCKYLSERGAVCCFSFAVHTSGGVSADDIRNKTSGFISTLRSKLDDKYCTIISDISDYFLASDLFYDNNYHLTLEGADIRTRNLIEDLKAYLEE